MENKLQSLMEQAHKLATERAERMKATGEEVFRLSSNLELAINEERTEVAINRTDNRSCFIDIVVKDGKLEVVYCDEGQKDY